MMAKEEAARHRDECKRGDPTATAPKTATVMIFRRAS